MKSIAGRLNKYLGTDIVVRIDRTPIDEYHIDGFVLAVNKNLLLLHEVDGRTLILNGYSTVRLKDITSAKPLGGFTTRALRLLDRKPVANDLDISGWGALLDSAQQRYPLLSIEQEIEAPGCLFIGRIARQTSRFVDLKEIDPKAVWKRSRRYKFKEITKVTIDDGYAKALAELDAYESSDHSTTAISATAR